MCPSVIGSQRASMHAHCRHSGAVVTITGDIDAANIDVVLDFASLFMPTGNAAALDLSRVGFFAAQSISLLIAIDDLCRTAEVSWSLVPSRAVSRVLKLTNRDGDAVHSERRSRDVAGAFRDRPCASPSPTRTGRRLPLTTGKAKPPWQNS